MLIQPKTLLEFREKGIYIYDNSSIAKFLSCPLYYNYKHELGLTRKDTTPGFGLTFGQCLHAALKVWVDSSKNDTLASKKFIQLFKPHEEQPNISKKTGKELSATYTTLYGCSLLLAYFNKYRNDTRPIAFTEIAVMEELAPDVYYGGRIDKLLEEPRFADYKSTKYPNNILINPNPQFMGYKFLTSKLLDKNVSGEVDILPVSKTKDPEEQLIRIPFDYTPYQMENWRKSMIYHINQITNCRSMNYWPQAWDCTPFGRYECDYSPLCTLTKAEALMPLMQSMYAIEHWDFMSEI